MRKQFNAVSIMVGLCVGLFGLAGNDGCGGTGGIGGEPCTFDSECPTGNVCDGEVSGTCVPTCIDDTDCFEEESCQTRDSDPAIKLCVVDNGENNGDTCETVDDCPNVDDYVCTDGACVEIGGGNTCETVDDCPNVDDYVCTDGACVEIGGGNTCETVDDCPNSDDYVCDAGVCKSISENNNNVSNPIFVVQIEDVTTDADACSATTNGLGDGGSDLTYARLLDSDGQVLGFAEQVDCAPASGSEYTNCSHFDGAAPDIGDDSCPIEDGGRFRLDTIFSTGCGGYILVQFLDKDSGQPIPISPGNQIEVGEFGPNCGGSGDDLWQVYLCTDTADAREFGTSSCTEPVGDATTGSFAVTVDTIPG